ncbi:MAG: hypothetical protein CSA75_04475 [Sorangium cellulosum]|nr:MAG: hypothetical protein CSA75_04475 [Sorangium cellulosum]
MPPVSNGLAEIVKRCCNGLRPAPGDREVVIMKTKLPDIPNLPARCLVVDPISITTASCLLLGESDKSPLTR